MVRKVRRADALGYLRQADEFLCSAQDNLQMERFNAAGFNAIQSMINANDALTIYFLERRASKDHKEAMRLHIDVIKVIKDDAQRDRLKKSLDMRSTVGYLGKPVSENDARKLVRYAATFVKWVKRYVRP